MPMVLVFFFSILRSWLLRLYICVKIVAHLAHLQHHVSLPAHALQYVTRVLHCQWLKNCSTRYYFNSFPVFCVGGWVCIGGVLVSIGFIIYCFNTSDALYYKTLLIKHTCPTLFICQGAFPQLLADERVGSSLLLNISACHSMLK